MTEQLSTRSIRTRRRILDGALAVFRAKGYHGCSLPDLAEAGSVSVPGLYHHFESKQELLFTVLREGLEELVADLSNAETEHPDDIRARFDALVRALAVFQARRTVVSFVFVSELRSLEGEFAREAQRHRLRIQQYFDDVIADGRQHGVFDSPEGREVSRAVVALCVNISTWFAADGPSTPEQVADTYVLLANRLARTAEVSP